VKIEELERLVAIEQGTGSSTSQDRTDSNTLQLPPAKEDIRRDVYAAVVMSGRWVRRAEIAKLLNLKKTPWLNTTIEQLVIDGYLIKYIQERPNQLPVCYYDVRR
jgi:hypothetical protein